MFGRELDDASIDAPTRAFDPVALGKSIERLQAQHADASVSYVMATGGAPERYDVLIYGGAAGDTFVRLDGAGNTLRENLGLERPRHGEWRNAR